MSKPETILRVALLPDGRLEYQDWKGRVNSCRPEELGARCRELLAEPDLPRVEVVNPGVSEMAEQYARVFLPPEYQSLARPGVVAVEKLFRSWVASRQASAQRAGRQQQQGSTQGNAQRSEPDPPQPPRPPHRSARRRGQRIA